MTSGIYEAFNKQYEIAKKLLCAAKNSQFQIKTVPKISKAQLISFFELAIEGLNTVRNMHEHCEINIVKKFENEETRTPIEMTTIDGKVMRIFTREQLEKLKEEIVEIEEYYPGENALTEHEKMCKPFYNSLHDFQYFISQVRRGTTSIIINEDGCTTTVVTE